jgi:hypothetical protein
VIAQLGLSDVSASVYGAKGILPAQTPVQKTSNTYVAQPSGAGQGFGVIVSKKLYDLLATDQGVAVPSITSGQMATIMSTTGLDNMWPVLLKNSANTPASTNLIFSRRKPDSGTQASAEIFFLNNPCSKTPNLSGYLDAAGSTSSFYENPTALGDVTFVQEASSNKVLERMTQNSKNDYVIGVVSVENQEVPADWRYLKVDGVHPGTDAFQKENILNGSYKFAFESTILRSTSSGVNPINPTLVTALVAKFTKGQYLASAYGLYSDPLAATYVAGTTANDDVTSHYSRGGKECQVATKVW